MATTRFHSILEERIKEVVENHRISLASGASADYAQYRHSVGYISGLLDALKICDEIEKEFS